MVASKSYRCNKIFKIKLTQIYFFLKKTVQNAIASALNNNCPNKLKQSNKEDKSNPKAQLLSQLVIADPANRYCADCKSEDPEWASINLGILICIKCSGVHRQLGTHISKVRSLTLDSLDKELKNLILSLGNTNINGIYEAELPDDKKINIDTDGYIYDDFI